MTSDHPLQKEICSLELSIVETQKKIASLQLQLPEEAIDNYEVKSLDNKSLHLLDLFGPHEELLLIHNMGFNCPYCTLWADGFRTLKTYFESRCAFVLETDESPAELKAFVAKRKWDFNVVSSQGTSLKQDLGFRDDKSNHPGVSSLFKKGDQIYRHATAPFGPGDRFCNAWHFFDLLKHGQSGWQPKFNL